MLYLILLLFCLLPCQPKNICMKFTQDEEILLHKWLSNELLSIHQSDHNVLAEYIITILKQPDRSKSKTGYDGWKQDCVEQLNPFLKAHTRKFVDKLFYCLQDSSYKKIANSTDILSERSRKEGRSSKRRNRRRGEDSEEDFDDEDIDDEDLNLVNKTTPDNISNSRHENRSDDEEKFHPFRNIDKKDERTESNLPYNAVMDEDQDESLAKNRKQFEKYNGSNKSVNIIHDSDVANSYRPNNTLKSNAFPKNSHQNYGRDQPDRRNYQSRQSSFPGNNFNHFERNTLGNEQQHNLSHFHPGENSFIPTNDIGAQSQYSYKTFLPRQQHSLPSYEGPILPYYPPTNPLFMNNNVINETQSFLPPGNNPYLNRMAADYPPTASHVGNFQDDYPNSLGSIHTFPSNMNYQAPMHSYNNQMNYRGLGNTYYIPNPNESNGVQTSNTGKQSGRISYEDELMMQYSNPNRPPPPPVQPLSYPLTNTTPMFNSFPAQDGVSSSKFIAPLPTVPRPSSKPSDALPLDARLPSTNTTDIEGFHPLDLSNVNSELKSDSNVVPIVNEKSNESIPIPSSAGLQNVQSPSYQSAHYPMDYYNPTILPNPMKSPKNPQMFNYSGYSVPSYHDELPNGIPFTNEAFHSHKRKTFHFPMFDNNKPSNDGMIPPNNMIKKFKRNPTTGVNMYRQGMTNKYVRSNDEAIPKETKPTIVEEVVPIEDKKDTVQNEVNHEEDGLLKSIDKSNETKENIIQGMDDAIDASKSIANNLPALISEPPINPTLKKLPPAVSVVVTASIKKEEIEMKKKFEDLKKLRDMENEILRRKETLLQTQLDQYRIMIDKLENKPDDSEMKRKVVSDLETKIMDMQTQLKSVREQIEKGTLSVTMPSVGSIVSGENHVGKPIRGRGAFGSGRMHGNRRGGQSNHFNAGLLVNGGPKSYVMSDKPKAMSWVRPSENVVNPGKQPPNYMESDIKQSNKAIQSPV